MSQLLKPPASLEAPAAPRSLKGSLGVTAIVFMVVAAAAPLTVIGGAAPLGILLGNGVGYPAMYAIAGVILLLFAVGLAAMTRVVPKPGAFFTYVGYGLGKAPGMAAAWLAMLTYTGVQVSVYGYIGYILQVTIAGIGGPDIPWYLWALAVIVSVGVLGYRHVDLSSKVLGVLLVAEVLVVLAIVAAVLVTGGDEGLSLATFEPANVMSGSPGIGLMMAIAAFIGFEATAIFRDEARDPDRTIPRATYAAVIGIGLFYTLGSWALVMAWGPGSAVAVAAEDPGSMILVTMAKYFGVAGEIIMNVLLITSMFACVLSFHNVITRYQLSMSNAGLMPERLGRVHAKHVSPYVSSVVQSITAAACIAVFAVLGLDPVLQVFTWGAGVATLAIAVLMAAACLAVIVYFVRTRADRRVWNTVVAPGLGLVGLVAASVLIVAYFPVLVGDVDAGGTPVFGAISALLIGIIAFFPIFGLLQAYYLKRHKPRTYEGVLEELATSSSSS